MPIEGMNRGGRSGVGRTPWLLAMVLAPIAGLSSVALADVSKDTVRGTALGEPGDLVGSSPEALALVSEAEAAARAGHSREAWGLFGRAWSLAPRSPAPPRGICRLALTLGIGNVEQRKAAGTACQNALMLGGTPEDMRNRVAASLGGAVLPSMEDLVSASFAVEGAARMGPGQPWGALAQGDLAIRLGDRDLLDAATAELDRLAPDQRRDAIHIMDLSTSRRSRWIWFGRLTVAAIGLVTLVDALARRWRRQMRRTLSRTVSSVATFVIVAVGSGWPARAHALPIDDAHPETSVEAVRRSGNPMALADLLMDLTKRAEDASTHGDRAAAARLWRAVTLAVPERTYGYSRFCDALEAIGQIDEAVTACRTAILRQGPMASDYTHFVRLLLARSPRLSDDDRRQIGVALAQLDAEPRAALIATRVRCDLATHEHDRQGLEACTAKLEAQAPDDWRTATFAWALAFEKKDRDALPGWLAKARSAGAPAEVLARLTAGTEAIGGLPSWKGRALRWAIAGVGGFWLLLGLAALLRRQKPIGNARRLTCPLR